jgi:hypothetical protein
MKQIGPSYYSLNMPIRAQTVHTSTASNQFSQPERVSLLDAGRPLEVMVRTRKNSYGTNGSVTDAFFGITQSPSDSFHGVPSVLEVISGYINRKAVSPMDNYEAKGRMYDGRVRQSHRHPSAFRIASVRVCPKSPVIVLKKE